MSNESENERIDLTQFEGITEGPWFIDIEDKPMRLRKVWTDEDDAKHSIPDYDLDKFDVAIVEHINPEAGFTISKPNFRGIEMVPDLIAELKRCYAELDHEKKISAALWDTVDNYDICLDCYTVFDLHDNLPDDHKWCDGITCNEETIKEYNQASM